MSEFSDYLENGILEHTLRGSALSTPATIYVALFTADPTDANVTANEVTTGNWPAYAREDAAQAGVISSGWATASGGTTSNAKELVWAANNGAASVTVTHIGIYDQLTGGNLLYHTALTASKTLQVSDVISFAIGAITVTLN